MPGPWAPTVSTTTALVTSRGATPSDYVELTKPRITLMVVVTAAVGFVVAGGGAGSSLLAATLVGTALVAAGASVFNMLLERRSDALMRRTRNRPLPARRLRPGDALAFGALLSLAGLIQLYLFSGALAAQVALLTWFSYVCLYTPLKTRTSLAILVGAVPGALPPMIGWAATRGSLDGGAGIIFSILFLWQVPHFLAIAWIYRDDYASGGLPMLPVLDTRGDVTARQAVVYSVALYFVSLTPSLAGLTGTLYLAGATVLGALLLMAALRLAVKRSLAAARLLFVVSLVYLTGLCALLLLDRS